MNTTHYEALRSAVITALKGRVDVAWDGEPEPFASWGLVARLSVTADTERGGGGYERRRVLVGQKLKEATIQRRTALVTIRLEALHPGADPPAGALAARLHSRVISDALSAAGVELVRAGSVRYLNLPVDSRVLQAGIVELTVHYTEQHDGLDELGDDWIEQAPVGGTVT